MSFIEKHSRRKCPVCTGLQSEVLFKQRFQGIPGARLLDGYDVVVCDDCGAVFSDRLPSVERFAEYYTTTSKYEFSHRSGEQHGEEMARVAGLAKWLANLLPHETSLLDVGCATGELLLRLRREGFSDITGLDPSRDCVERARSLHGLTMIEGALSSKNKEQRSYGAVILSAVLEHIPDTEKFVADLLQWTLPSGYLVVEVPDLEFFDQSRNAPFQELSVEHVNFFTNASLNNLMQRFGYQAIAERHFICPAAPGGLTGAVLTMLFQKSETTGKIKIKKEGISRKSMESYLKQSREILESEKSLIESLIESQKPLLVWGTGTLCQRILAEGRLGEANIISFVDSNPHYQGKTLAGRPILAPREITTDDAILITSWGFQEEITHAIRSDLSLKNQIITFR